MKVNDTIQLRGCLKIALKDIQGNIVDYREINNTVVTTGRKWVLERIKSESPASETISHMAIGVSTTAPATSQTALVNENNRKSIGTFNTGGLTDNPPSWESVSSWATNEGNTTLGEVGLFNSSSGGTMLARATFSTINKTTSNTLTVSYVISN